MSDPILEHLAHCRYESARRVGLALMAQGRPTFETVYGLYQAYISLSDFHAAKALLEEWRPRFPEHGEMLTRALAKLYRAMATEAHYRLSQEAKQGYCVDEYLAKYRALAAETLATAGLAPLVPEPGPQDHSTPEPAPERLGRGGLQGRIFDEAGRPLGGVKVVLGLETPPVVTREENTFGLGYLPKLPPMPTREVRSDPTGAFRFEDLPVGVHDYLAVCLDGAMEPMATRFLRHAVAVEAGVMANLGGLLLKPWQSAAPLQTALPTGPEGLASWEVRNPFDYAFRPQPVLLPLPDGGEPNGPVHVVTQDGPVPFQMVGRSVLLLAGLAAQSRLQVRLVAGASEADSALCWSDDGAHWTISTGVASFRIAGNAGPRLAPILGVRGADGVWRGTGRYRLPEGVSVSGGHTKVLEQGPVRLRFSLETRFSNGQRHRVELTAHAGEPLLLVKELAEPLEGAVFEFSLREFSGGRGYLHWKRESGDVHWSTLAAVEERKAALPESVPWWIPPYGFAYALTQDGLEGEDYLAVLSLRRGEWVDRAFERIAQGPINADGSPNPELDWPYPEMIGSSISEITVDTTADGDVCMRFGLFDGERQWGLLASRFSENDGLYKEIAAIQHAYSSPRLTDFAQWSFDAADAVERPHGLLHRRVLPALREKRRRYPSLWKAITEGNTEGPVTGFRFAMEGDPVLAWKLRSTLLAVARVRSRATLMGRDWSDMYSPVGGRAITHWVLEYDLVAGSGVFTPSEEREVRAFFILMGHLFMEKDLMNWSFNARNANFEADRAEIVGTIGLVFAGHPDSGKFLAHAQERLRSMLRVYCNPESGKWYENPACYYRVACRSWSNLAVHLARHGVLRLGEVPLLREFLHWGITLLTPPLPPGAVLHRGDARAYEEGERVRHIPPVGDHAGLGHWMMGHYYSIGKAFAWEDPAFSRRLIDAFYQANLVAARTLHDGPEMAARPVISDHPHAQAQEAGLISLFIDLEPDEAPQPLALESERLSGFGAVLRNRVDTAQEDYLLIKQGPGGYRYHRTEGSFIYFAAGRPLIYDGGEAGETWRHSTLSFYDVHMPIAPGRVEHYFGAPALHVVRGVHPEVVRPGEPVFLSDRCHHELVQESYRRYACPRPALVRTFMWVGSDYLVLADRLDTDAPSHWHLQVVADRVERVAKGEYHFQGRHGVDLQLLFPGQGLNEEVLAPLPVHEYRVAPEDSFSMLHLQMADPAGRGYLAVLRPRSAGAVPLVAERLCHGGETIGVAIRGEGFDDRLWFHRGEAIETDGFYGSCGALLLRPEGVSIWLGEPGRVEWPGGVVEAGPGVRNLFWTRAADGEESLRAEGDGEVTIDSRSYEVNAAKCYEQAGGPVP